MLLVLHKVFFIGNEAVLLCETMWEHARAFAATISCITFWCSFCHYKVQFLWCTFQTRFDMGTRYFQKVVFRMKLFLSLWSFICHIADTGVWKYVFTCVVIKVKNFHSCRTRVDRVSLCRIRVAFVSLALHSCRTHVVK